MKAQETNVIIVEAGGPYVCRGRIELEAADGTVLETEGEISLCRCGRSRNKPYCDGSHVAVPADSRLATAEVTDLQDAQGTLRIRPRPDGPLKLEGPCEVRSADATVLMRGSETALCRCGRSARRPFCDGTHRRQGSDVRNQASGSTGTQ